MPAHPDVVIVGAGPAGLGVASALRRSGVRPLVVDRHGVGASFRRWPAGTRLLTPSFTSNLFGAVDLNAITPDTSPAMTLLEEHPTGPQYADYLEDVVKIDEIDVTEGVDVVDVEPRGDDGRLSVRVIGGPDIHARHVVWAAGEALYPHTAGFDGAELCHHTITVRAWDHHPGTHVVVIGGYESGIDAACQLVSRGRRVTVLDGAVPWEVIDADPSVSLSPHTHGRLRRALATGQLTLVGDSASGVERTEGGFAVRTPAGRSWVSHGPPLLATGFDGSLTMVRDRFEWTEGGAVVVTEEAEESTVVPGLHLAGPALAHRGAVFCFVYKFRQRFAVVAAAIARELDGDPEPMLAEHRALHFVLEDLSCCEGCAC